MLEGILSAIDDGDISARYALFDWLQEHGKTAKDIKAPIKPHPALASGYDWDEVFGYADGGKDHSCQGGVPELTRPDAPKIDTSPFTLADVATVSGMKEGENDSEDWLVYGVLWDGRAFGIKAGCDYTGWG